MEIATVPGTLTPNPALLSRVERVASVQVAGPREYELQARVTAADPDNFAEWMHDGRVTTLLLRTTAALPALLRRLADQLEAQDG